jgi:hypothetical protein
MEPEGPLPHSQQPSTGHILNYLNPIHILTFYFLKFNFKIKIALVVSVLWPVSVHHAGVNGLIMVGVY